MHWWKIITKIIVEYWHHICILLFCHELVFVRWTVSVHPVVAYDQGRLRLVQGDYTTFSCRCRLRLVQGDYTTFSCRCHVRLVQGDYTTFSCRCRVRLVQGDYTTFSCRCRVRLVQGDYTTFSCRCRLRLVQGNYTTFSCRCRLRLENRHKDQSKKSTFLVVDVSISWKLVHLMATWISYFLNVM